jgi:hypothetical protein
MKKIFENKCCLAVSGNPINWNRKNIGFRINGPGLGIGLRDRDHLFFRYQSIGHPIFEVFFNPSAKMIKSFYKTKNKRQV